MYPAMLNIKDKLITVVGGGKVAYRKTRTFLEFGGKVRVFSPVFDEQFKYLEGVVECIVREYSNLDLKESFLVVAGTNNEGVNKEVGVYCAAHNILCNVVDNRELSSFIVPAYMKKGDLTISVSTNGKSPSLAGKIKKELSEKYDENYIEYLEILGRIRERVIVYYDNEKMKKEILHYLVTLNLEELKVYEEKFLQELIR